MSTPYKWLTTEAMTLQSQRNELKALCATAWGYPDKLELQARVRELGCEPVNDAAVRVGETLLVAYVPGSASGPPVGRVYLLCEGGRQPFVKAALTSWDESAAHAERDAPFYAFAHARSVGPPAARPLFSIGPKIDLLDGSSFGLAFALSRIAHWTGLTVPAQFATSAGVSAVGRLTTVAGLREKLQAVSEYALGVTHFIVAKGDEELANAITTTLARPLRILAMHELKDVVRVVFSPDIEVPPAWWQDEARKDEAFSGLSALVYRGRQTSWDKLIPVLTWYAEANPSPQARTVLRIARRHSGATDCAMPWDNDSINARGHEAIAHIVQAAADSGDADCRCYVDRALDRIKVAPAEVGSIMALGACARALATMRQYELAKQYSIEAVDRWLRRDEPEQASRALSEWLRVASILRDSESFDRAWVCAMRYQKHLGDNPYVKLARLGGLVRMDRVDDALEFQQPFERAPDEVLRCQSRWRARTYDSQEPDRAKQLRATLDNSLTKGAVEPILARIDEALATQSDPRSALNQLISLKPQGLRWILEATEDSTLADRARIVTEEYPY